MLGEVLRSMKPQAFSSLQVYHLAMKGCAGFIDLKTHF